MIVPAHLVMDLARKEAEEDFAIKTFIDLINIKIIEAAKNNETYIVFNSFILNGYTVDILKRRFEARGYSVVVNEGEGLTFSWPKNIGSRL